MENRRSKKKKKKNTIEVKFLRRDIEKKIEFEK